MIELSDRVLWVTAGVGAAALFFSVRALLSTSDEYPIESAPRQSHVTVNADESLPVKTLATLLKHPTPQISEAATHLLISRLINGPEVITQSIRNDTASYDASIRQQAIFADRFLKHYFSRHRDIGIRFPAQHAPFVPSNDASNDIALDSPPGPLLISNSAPDSISALRAIAPMTIPIPMPTSPSPAQPIPEMSTLFDIDLDVPFSHPHEPLDDGSASEAPDVPRVLGLTHRVQLVGDSRGAEVAANGERGHEARERESDVRRGRREAMVFHEGDGRIGPESIIRRSFTDRTQRE